MAWGTELWDQYDNISLHTQKGLDFLEKYGRLVRDRSDVENRYAADLRNLVKKYQPKKKDDDDMQFTAHTAYRAMLSEVGDLAGQHEVVAEQLAASVVSDVTAIIKELKDERKRLLHEASRLQSQLNQQRLQLDKAKRNYDKSAREAEKALENYHRADADFNLSRAEVEKQKMNSSLRDQQCEDNKNEYANQLQRTNDLQAQHYLRLLPAIYDDLQSVDERRSRCLQAHLRRAVDIERHVFPIIHTCLDGIVRAADTIDPQQDSAHVIERYKSGFEPPESIPFEDLSSARNGDVSTPHVSVPVVNDSPRGLTIKGTLSAAKFKRRGGLFGIFSGSKNSSPNASFESFMKEDLDSLPPNQRRKKIRQRVDEVTAKINQETATRDGLMKMKGVYEGNPALGDPMTIESQLHENTHRLEKLRCELHKYQSLLDADVQRTSLSEPDSNLSRSASDSSVNQPPPPPAAVSAPGLPGREAGHAATLPSHISSNSPESGLGTSHTSLPDSESDGEPHHQHHHQQQQQQQQQDESANGYNGEQDAYIDELLPVLSDASALYPFEASSEGSIPMQEGEQLLVIELDQGDGWTRVRRQHSLEEGFVPTAYLQIHAEG